MGHAIGAKEWIQRGGVLSGKESGWIRVEPEGPEKELIRGTAHHMPGKTQEIDWIVQKKSLLVPPKQ